MSATYESSLKIEPDDACIIVYDEFAGDIEYISTVRDELKFIAYTRREEDPHKRILSTTQQYATANEAYDDVISDTTYTLSFNETFASSQTKRQHVVMTFKFLFVSRAIAV